VTLALALCQIPRFKNQILDLLKNQVDHLYFVSVFFFGPERSDLTDFDIIVSVRLHQVLDSFKGEKESFLSPWMIQFDKGIGMSCLIG
jgi:hypothetical protein